VIFHNRLQNNCPDIKRDLPFIPPLLPKDSSNPNCTCSTIFNHQCPTSNNIDEQRRVTSTAFTFQQMRPYFLKKK